MLTYKGKVSVILFSPTKEKNKSETLSKQKTFWTFQNRNFSTPWGQLSNKS